MQPCSREASRVHSGEQGARFVSDQNDRTDLIGTIEQNTQFLGHARGDVLAIPRFAPAEARAIVAADARHLRDLGLNPSPRGRHASRSGFEDDHG